MSIELSEQEQLRRQSLAALRELGIEHDQLEAVAKQARYDGAALYNATEVTIEDAMEILEAVF